MDGVFVTIFVKQLGFGGLGIILLCFIAISGGLHLSWGNCLAPLKSVEMLTEAVRVKQEGVAAGEEISTFWAVVCQLRLFVLGKGHLYLFHTSLGRSRGEFKAAKEES